MTVKVLQNIPDCEGCKRHLRNEDHLHEMIEKLVQAGADQITKSRTAEDSARLDGYNSGIEAAANVLYEFGTTPPRTLPPRWQDAIRALRNSPPPSGCGPIGETE